MRRDVGKWADNQLDFSFHTGQPVFTFTLGQPVASLYWCVLRLFNQCTHALDFTLWTLKSGLCALGHIFQYMIQISQFMKNYETVLQWYYQVDKDGNGSISLSEYFGIFEEHGIVVNKTETNRLSLIYQRFDHGIDHTILTMELIIWHIKELIADLVLFKVKADTYIYII